MNFKEEVNKNKKQTESMWRSMIKNRMMLKLVLMINKIYVPIKVAVVYLIKKMTYIVSFGRSGK